jgi:hypothetical protein
MTVYAIVADSTTFEIDRLSIEQFCRLIPTEGCPHRGPCMMRSVPHVVKDRDVSVFLWMR